MAKSLYSKTFNPNLQKLYTYYISFKGIYVYKVRVKHFYLRDFFMSFYIILLLRTWNNDQRYLNDS